MKTEDRMTAGPQDIKREFDRALACALMPAKSRSRYNLLIN